MQFFEHQDRARGRTTLLVVLFLLAVLALGTLTSSAVHFLLSWGRQDQEPLTESHWSLVATTAICTFGVILLGSAYRMAQLSGGGKKVAETLGGSHVAPTTTDPLERRAINVVEEMAISAGLPVPPLYVLRREKGINAFAAGWSPDDAVIGVTQGALENLRRDHLQGVIAHEFSHILNRDSALNMRLMGVLHGIVLISVIGRIVMRLSTGSRHSSTRREGGAVQFFLLGAAIWLFGSIGVLIARLIQAAVSRQREFLADASAVQFTRNPESIAGALATIGSHTSTLDTPRSGETSHMLIGDPGSSSFLGSLSSHPPLFERISRILPRWSGDFGELATPAGSVLQGLRADASPDTGDYIPGLPQELNLPQSPGFPQELGPGLVLEPLAPLPNPDARSPQRTEEKEQPGLAQARVILAGLPDSLRSSAETPFSCRAIILALVLDGDHKTRPSGSDRTALSLLEESPRLISDAALTAETARLLPGVAQLPLAARLPLFDISLSSLAALSERQTQRFIEQLEEVQTRLFDRAFSAYCLVALSLRHLDPQARIHQVRPLLIKDAIEMTLSALSHQGHETLTEANEAFLSGAGILGKRGARLQLMSEPNVTVSGLDSALFTLLRLPLRTRKDLLRAAERIAENDGRLRPSEIELLRTIAVTLNVAAAPLELAAS